MGRSAMGRSAICAAILLDAGSSTCAALTPASVKNAAPCRHGRIPSHAAAYRSGMVPDDGARREIDDCEREVPRRLRRDISQLAIRTDRDRMRLPRWHRPDDGARCGVDESDALLGVDRHEYQPAVAG